MSDRPMDSSTSQTTEVTAVYTVSFTDGISRPENIGSPTTAWDEEFIQVETIDSKWEGSANTLPEALELAADYMTAFRKDLLANGCEVPEDAQCFIDMRVCGTKGTTTQTVHLIS